MFSTPAYAATAGAAPTGIQGFLASPFGTLLTFLPIIILFYFLMIRPQQQRMKKHQAMIGAVKRGDQVVLSNGMFGKVTRVETDEVQVEVAPNTNVRVVKAMIGEIRAKTTPLPANDSKS